MFTPPLTLDLSLLEEGGDKKGNTRNRQKDDFILRVTTKGQNALPI